uniref:beta-2 adrenergic receptor-like n=1 Tax=Styela clava TaxID=7725 RepID=UPI0019393CA8|nr:beta-2 adrenergic receptor-like [Styela clava]
MKGLLLLCISPFLPLCLTLEMDKFLDKGCSSNNDFLHSNVELRESCCRQLFFSARELVQYMKRMEEWNCSRLTSECHRRDYAYTSFSKCVYSRYCNNSNFRKECSSTLLTAFKYNQKNFSDEDPESITNKMWNEMITPLGRISPNDGLFSESCIQVATYDLPGNYEVVVRNLPICGPIYCRIKQIDKSDGKISSWKCSHTRRCLISSIVLISAFVIMSVLIGTSNLIVIIVFLRNERMVMRSSRNKKVKNSQSVYKLSIAVSDLAVGLFVCPCFILMYGHVFLNAIQAAEYYFVLSLTASISFCVSWLTLTTAGLDRVYAIMYPLRYSQHNGIRTAKMAVVSIWFVCICVSVFPFPIKSEDTVKRMSKAFVMISDDTSFITVACILLGIIWSSAFAVFAAVKKHRKATLDLLFSSDSNTHAMMQAQNAEVEKKLAITLCIMIGAFTASLLPTLMLHILSMASMLDNQSFATTTTLEAFALLILVSNSLWNCIVYNFRNKEFRDEFKSFLTFEKTTPKNKDAGSSSINSQNIVQSR